MDLNFVEDRPFAIESPVDVVEGSSITFACTGWGAVSSPSAVAYRKKTTVTSTVFPTNSPSASGSVITLSPATGLVGGANYIIAVTFTLLGDVFVRKIELICSKDEAER